MTRDTRDAAPRVVELDAVLDAKVSVTRLRPGSMNRAEIIEAARVSNCRVVGLAARAGYGTSTLLYQ